mmetsp:Transcript_35368/g.101885  ORF Transcript_35368/g.101885 Transcript_35368/m.101885 type:complete len:275 (-) Transcript_35368:1539-2363(-)
MTRCSFPRAWTARCTSSMSFRRAGGWGTTSSSRPRPSLACWSTPTRPRGATRCMSSARTRCCGRCIMGSRRTSSRRGRRSARSCSRTRRRLSSPQWRSRMPWRRSDATSFPSTASSTSSRATPRLPPASASPSTTTSCSLARRMAAYLSSTCARKTRRRRSATRRASSRLRTRFSSRGHSWTRSRRSYWSWNGRWRSCPIRSSSNCGTARPSTRRRWWSLRRSTPRKSMPSGPSTSCSARRRMTPRWRPRRTSRAWSSCTRSRHRTSRALSSTR